jgi:hypothetical protein
MVHLDLYEVLAVAARVMGCEAAEVVAQADLEALGLILAAARSADLPGDPAPPAAALLGGFVRRRPFRGPNRVIGVAVTLQFLSLNGYDLELEPAAELDALLDRLARGDLSPAEFIHRVRVRVIPVLSLGVPELTDHPAAEQGEEIDMYERFTDRARRVVVLAQDEARKLHHDYVGTEHVLLAMLQDGDGIAVKVLADLGISAPAVRGVVETLIGPGSADSADIGGHIPFTARAKTVLELAHREASQLGDDFIGTEHILLGMIREGEGVAALALGRLGADLDKVRQQVIEELGRHARADSALRSFLTESLEDPGPTEPPGSGRRHLLLAELSELLDENEKLHDEVARLRRILREHDLDPDA